MSEVIDGCEHDFLYIESIYKREGMAYQRKYTRIDRFYCRKCLLETEKKREECSRDTPEWYQS